jgi:hypothetical protein
MAYPDSSPVVEAELECITVAIRREQTRLLDEEFDTGVYPNDWNLQYLRREKARGVLNVVTNF